ncbi:MAG: lipid-A-disaccharide synthase [Deltaproteobacteria bacterium]
MEKTLVVIAGEASGDLHAARLVEELKTLFPAGRFYGLGGEKMRAAGVTLWHDLTQLAVVGFVEVLKHYATFKRVFDDTLARILSLGPDAVILVDYPGFNLRLARELRKHGIRVVYFISPQVWAWGRERIGAIRRDVDLMLVLFRFEEELYKDGVLGKRDTPSFHVRFVGHPLLDAVRPAGTRAQVLAGAGFEDGGPIVGLLPGSREREIRALLPVMLESADRIHRKYPRTQFLICRASTVPRQLYKETIARGRHEFPYKILDNDTYSGVAASDIVLVASGTATLETAILGRPMIILYKVSLLTWLLAKACVRIPFIGLVNVVAGRKVVPELIQFDATPSKVVAAFRALWEDPERLTATRAALAAVKESLGAPGACRRAAEAVASFLA